MQNQHEPFMRHALSEAQQALAAGEFPVGCVLVRQGVVIGRGHRTNSGAAAVNELDHAEIMALRDLASRQTLPPGPSGIIVYSTMEPCLMCYAALLLSGIRTIVYAYEDAMGGGTDLKLAHLAPLYRQMEVEITPYVLREESLTLFRQFFNDPAHSYWKGSHLAEYTLAQP